MPSMKFSNPFHKRHTKAPEQATPGSSAPEQVTPGSLVPAQATSGSLVPAQATSGSLVPAQATSGSLVPARATPGFSAPGPSANTSSSPIQLSANKIFKNTIMFASVIAGNAGIPWVKIVSESIIGIIQRLDAMKLNETALGDLQNDIEAFLYIVVRNGRRNPDDELVERFKTQIQSIQLPVTPNSFVRFLSVQETKNIITRLKQNLDSAVQLFQTGLQLALVDAMDEFKEWRDSIENNRSDGEVVKKLLNLTYTAKGAFNIRTEAPGDISITSKDNKFKTEKNFNQYTRGANVTETQQNNKVDAEGDIDLTTIATGNPRGFRGF